MKTIQLKSKSSSGNFYLVEFIIDEKIKVNCNCNAGIFGKLCRHKIGFLELDYSLLYDSKEKHLLDGLEKYIKNSEFPKLIEELNVAKKEILDAKKNEVKLKHRLERILREGFQYRE